MKLHPHAVVNPRGPTAGHLVVDVNLVTGVFDSEAYRWLRENFEPSGHIAHGYLVYNIKPADLSQL